MLSMLLLLIIFRRPAFKGQSCMFAGGEVSVSGGHIRYWATEQSVRAQRQTLSIPLSGADHPKRPSTSNPPAHSQLTHPSPLSRVTRHHWSPKEIVTKKELELQKATNLK